MKFPQNQKWESIKAGELNKRIEQKKKKEWVHTKEQPEWNKERKEETFKKPIQKQALIKREKALPMSEF